MHLLQDRIKRNQSRNRLPRRAGYRIPGHHPVAPTHILIVPNRHIDSINALGLADEPLTGHLITTAGKLAKEEGIEKGGYRLITNTGVDGGQSVFHIHLHLIGGQRMRHPMG